MSRNRKIRNKIDPNLQLMDIEPKTDNQAKVLSCKDKHQVLHGSAGTGKSFLSSWNFTINAPSDDHGLGLWENMPSAHEHHPKYALSEKGDFLALAERDKKRIRPCPLTQLFVYRLPTESELRKTLSQRPAEKSGNEILAATQTSGEAANMPRSCKYTIPRIPLCLSTIMGDVTALSFSSADEETCAISAATQDSTRTWLLQDL